MAFIDEIKIFIKAGDGGDGVVLWRHEKGKDKAGAGGGNGGKGGDIYVEAVRDLALLSRYKHIKEITAQNGGYGMKNGMHGKKGKDTIVELPIGSIVKNSNTGEAISLTKEKEKVMVLKGGNGGYGNEYFKASTNVRPKEFTLGKKGESAEFEIELELVAEIGLLGLPNAGKSSLLNALTNAAARVGAYPFTTLEPNLGDMHGHILADIPGLIEGASQGKGLGHKFLRHIRRTEILLHSISIENNDLLEVYKIIRGELDAFDPMLTAKPEIIVLTKSDLATTGEIEKKKRKLKPLKREILVVSVNDKDSIKTLRDTLVKMLE